MRSSSVVSLSLALALGLLAAVIARSMIQTGNAGTAAKQIFIVVASKPVALGAALTPENLREVPWAGGAAIDGAFVSIADLTKDGRRLALVALQRNEPVLAGKITAPNQRATLSTQIEEGMRAVSVRVDEVRGVAGFILPGDRVDVILTRGETSAQDASAAYADVLLQNAKVLAIDQSASERPDKPAIARAVTLELNMQQAQAVILAQGIGRLSLVLRQTGASDEGLAERVTAADIGTASVNAIPPRQVADLERQLAETQKAAAEANSRVVESSQRMVEIEAGLRREIERLKAAPTPAPVAIVAPRPPARVDAVVNVTRNAAKREQYTVSVER